MKSLKTTTVRTYAKWCTANAKPLRMCVRLPKGEVIQAEDKHTLSASTTHLREEPVVCGFDLEFSFHVFTFVSSVLRERDG